MESTCYAKSNGWPYDFHAFATEGERDEWCDGLFRVPVSAFDVQWAVNRFGDHVLVHGEATIPDDLVLTTRWEYRPTARPDCRIAVAIDKER